MNAITISTGFKPDERAQAARLYRQAFGPKLANILGPEPRAHAFFQRALDPTHAICARDAHGVLLGMAGFKTPQGMFANGSMRDLAAVYGWLSLIWRVPLLMMLERELEPRTLLMDGLFVDTAARGRGVGTMLLDAIADEARRRNLIRVRLDVIDSNARARALYERRGFVAGKTSQLGPLRRVFGFASVTTMTLALADKPA